MYWIKGLLKALGCKKGYFGMGNFCGVVGEEYQRRGKNELLAHLCLLVEDRIFMLYVSLFCKIKRPLGTLILAGNFSVKMVKSFLYFDFNPSFIFATIFFSTVPTRDAKCNSVVAKSF